MQSGWKDGEPAVVLENVSCRFGKAHAIDDLSLTIPRGTVLGIVGTNGAGKTTLIELICGLFRPQHGRVLVLGQDVCRRPREVRRQIGVVPQETALYEEVTAWDNLRFAAALYGVPHARERIATLLELVGLQGRARDRVGILSGGMKRRLAIARALLHDPTLLILDEPTVGVDVEARHQIWSHIRSLRAQGRTVLLTTNYLDEAEALCDRVAFLQAGRLIAVDTPAALLRRVGHCLELHCSGGGVPQLEAALRDNHAVVRVEATDTSLTAYLQGNAQAEDVVRALLAITPLEGFRTRSPDLAEVFQALAAERVA